MINSRVQKTIFFFLVFLLPTQLGLHFWPSWSIVSGIRVDYFSPTLYLTDILTVILLILTTISVFNENRIKGYGLSVLKIKTKIVLLVLLALFALLNIYYSSSPPITTYYWCKILEIVSLIWCLVRFLKTNGPKLVLLALFLSFFYELVLSAWQFIMQQSVGGWWYFLGERTFTLNTAGIARLELFSRLTLRSYGTFSHPNVLAGYLVIILAITFFCKNSLSKTAKILFTSFTYLALVLTFSRTAIIIGIGLLFLWLFQNTKNKIHRFSLFLLFGLGVVLSLFVFSTFGTQSESVSVRSQLNEIAIKNLLKKPLIGSGLGTSPLYTLGNQGVDAQRLLTTNYSLFGQPVHNIYLLLLAETGLTGLLGFIFLIVFLFKNNHYSSRYILVVFLLLGLFDHYFFTSQQGQLLLALVFALQLVTHKLHL